MALDPSRVRDFAAIFGDFRVPSASLEIRTSVSTGSIAFSSSLNPNKGYFIACYGGDGLFGFGSSGPTNTEGTGSVQGIPLSEGVPYPFAIPSATNTTLRVRKRSGVGTVDFYLWEVSVAHF